MIKLLNCIVIFSLSLVVFGCAGGRNYDYRPSVFDLDYNGNNKAISVGVYDQRDYVLDGSHYPQYVGTQRSVAYVPWPINTKSGKAMVDDFLEVITKSLLFYGFKPDPVSLSEKDTKENVIYKLKSKNNERLLLFTVKEWYFDVHFSTRMEYLVELEVFDSEGILLTSVEEKNKWIDNAIPDVQLKR